MLRYFSTVVLWVTALTASAGVASWETFPFTQDSRDDTQDAWGARSEYVSASPGMPLPYRDVTASIYFQCEGSFEGLYIRFTRAPNLEWDQTFSGTTLYSVMDTRIDGVERIERVPMQIGSKDISLSSPYIRWIMNGNDMRIRLYWAGNRPVFRWNLAGSSQAIAQARRNCAGG